MPRSAPIVRVGLILALTGSLLLGCQTVRSWDQGCPGAYSGLRYFADHVGDLPADGKIFFTLDVPFSAIADTLVLPVSAFSRRELRKGGFGPGCRWAAK